MKEMEEEIDKKRQDVGGEEGEEKRGEMNRGMDKQKNRKRSKK